MEVVITLSQLSMLPGESNSERFVLTIEDGRAFIRRAKQPPLTRSEHEFFHLTADGKHLSVELAVEASS